MKRKSYNPRRRRGVVLIWGVITLLLLIALVGLALDNGYVALVHMQLQNAADGASLAAARLVKTNANGAQQAAVDIAAANAAAKTAVTLALNPGNDPAGDIVLGRYDRDTGAFTLTLTAPNAVKVVARRTTGTPDGPLPIIFGGAFGVSTVDVEARAIAMVGGGTGAGLIALNPSDNCSLRVSGTVNVNVNDGAIQVNSTSDCAACGNGTPLIDTPDLNIVGDPGACFNGGVEVAGDINPDSDPVPDPLAFLPAPTWDPMSDLGTINISSGSASLLPGYYSGGISVTGGIVDAAPGIYIVDGAGLDIRGNTTFTALGVMFYVIGDGVVDINGTGAVRITPPDPVSYSYPGVNTYESVTFFQARDNTNESRIIGTSLLELEGTLYFPAAPLEVGGTGDGFGNQLIADTMWVHGTGDITINYDGRYPAPGNKVFLVE